MWSYRPPVEPERQANQVRRLLQCGRCRHPSKGLGPSGKQATVAGSRRRCRPPPPEGANAGGLGGGTGKAWGPHAPGRGDKNEGRGGGDGGGGGGGGRAPAPGHSGAPPTETFAGARSTTREGEAAGASVSWGGWPGEGSRAYFRSRGASATYAAVQRVRSVYAVVLNQIF